MRRVRQIASRAIRTLAIIVALISFVAAQVGFPITMRSASASSTSTVSVRPCGCVVSDDCQKCCCCCSKPVEKPKPSPAPAVCCQLEDDAESCPLCREEPSAPKEDEEPTPAQSGADLKWVVGSVLQHCQGVQTAWLGMGAVLPLSADVDVPIDPSAHERVPIMNAIADARCVGPNDPPPRTTSA
jgi:hypothetical protein